MADFNVQLAGPAGAGANPVAGVQEPSEKGGLDPLVSGIGSIFAKGLEINRKEEAAQKEASIVGQFVSKQQVLNQAVASGQMRPEVAAAHSRAAFGSISAAYPQYIESLQKAANALKGFSEMGEINRQVEAEQKAWDAQRNQAIDAGFVFLPGMSKEVEKQQVMAAQAGIVAQRETQQFYAAQAEKRAQGTYNAGVAAKESKDLSFRLINDLAGTHLTAYQGFTSSLSEGVRTGRITPEQAQLQLSERTSNIMAGIAAAANVNPEVAAPYRDLFNQMNDVAKRMIDPKTMNEDAKAQLEKIQTQMKLVAMSNPRYASLIVSNQLLPNNLALQTNNIANEMLATLSQDPGAGFKPQVVLSPDQNDYLKLLKKGIQDVNGGKVQDKEIATTQASNNINELLLQTSKYLDQGTDPTQMKSLVDFFASPEYATMITGGKINPQAAGAAKRVFQVNYEPLIINSVQQKLQGTLVTPDPNVKNVNKTTVQDAVDVKFTGSGITFVPKPAKGMTGVELRNQTQLVQSLNSSQKAINQLIHMGAHMEGTTNYAQYWEQNKHVYLPSIFPAPNKLKEGQIVDGYKYLGGNYRDKANWEPVPTVGE